MTALNSFPSFVNDVDILMDIFVCSFVRERSSIVSVCPLGFVVVRVVTITKRRKGFFFDMSIGISLCIQCVMAVLGVLWTCGVT